MKRIRAMENDALRGQLAQALRRMRAMKRSKMSLDEVLRQLVVVKQQFGDAMKYIVISLRDQDATSGQSALTFSVDRQQLQRVARRPVARNHFVQQFNAH